VVLSRLCGLELVAGDGMLIAHEHEREDIDTSVIVFCKDTNGRFNCSVKTFNGDVGLKVIFRSVHMCYSQSCNKIFEKTNLKLTALIGS